VRHKRERGAARCRGTTSMIHREEEREGRSRRGWLLFLKREWHANEEIRGVRLHEGARLRSANFADRRRSIEQTRPRPNPLGGGGRESAGRVVGDEGGRMWALCRAYRTKERKRNREVGSLTGMVGEYGSTEGTKLTLPGPNIIIITGVTASEYPGTIPKER